MHIQVSPNVIFQELEDELILLNMDTEQYYGLDHTGAMLWKLIERHGDLDAIVDEFCQLYDVSHSQASEDLKKLIENFERAQLVLPVKL